MSSDFRRAQNRQVQKNAIFLDNVTNSYIYIMANNMVGTIEFTPSVLTNHNIIFCNGEVINTMNLRTLDENNRNAFYFLNENGTKTFLLYSNNDKIQMDQYTDNGTYDSTPFSVNRNTKQMRLSSNYGLIIPCSKIKFFDNTEPVSRQTASADATDLSSAITLINNLKNILKNYGLIN
jgi:hypothetical protein